jgi:hypothetical protein
MNDPKPSGTPAIEVPVAVRIAGPPWKGGPAGSASTVRASVCALPSHGISRDGYELPSRRACERQSDDRDAETDHRTDAIWPTWPIPFRWTSSEDRQPL